MSLTEPRTRSRVDAAVRLPVVFGGLGAAVPPGRVTNLDLAHQVETSDEWIVERTGIRERRRLGEGLGTAALATAAARRALADAGTDVAELDLLIVCTCTPDQPLPSTASLVAGALGARCPAMDLAAACTGWVYGLVTATSILNATGGRAALVVGAEVLSRWLAPDDRTVLPLFGDGAAAAVIRPGAGAGLVAWQMGSDPEGTELLRVTGGGSRAPLTPESLAAGEQYLKMDGREVFRRAIRAVESSCLQTLADAGVTAEDVDLFIPHQANARIVDALLPRLGISPERTMMNIERYGNTSGASIPLAICEAAAAGRLTEGSLVLLAGFGAGMTWASVLLRWGYSGSGPASAELRS